MDVTNLILQLKSKINNSPLDQQMIMKAVKQLELGAVFTVSTYAELPTASTSNGLLYYVLPDGLYFSAGGFWHPIVNTNYKIAYRWGANNYGQSGDGTTVARCSPVSVVGGFCDWVQISAGFYSSIALRANGTLWAWGRGRCGVSGNNSTSDFSSPVSVVGGFTDWCGFSHASTFAVGIRTNGTIWSWGRGFQGRLGNNGVTDRSSPVSVVGGFTDWCSVSVGADHAMALRGNGTIWTWGSNYEGQLGAGTSGSSSRSSPAIVIGGFTDWSRISTGAYHSMGIRTNGTLWSWGRNAEGQLGQNSSAARQTSPVSVAGEFTDWCAAAGGSAHSVALRSNGTLWAWGRNSSGQLGDGITTVRSSPVSVIGGFTDWCQIATGQNHTQGLRSNGTLWGWGYNSSGQIGDGTTTARSSPVSVVGGFTDWSSSGTMNTTGRGIGAIRNINL